MLGALMYAAKALLEFLPNIHLVGVFITATTVVYRKKALYPLYIYIFITGLFAGFSTWWLPYLYVWTILWAWVMLLPKSLPGKLQPLVYMSVCALHGFLFGTLYAPAWIVAGLPWDLIHGISNFFCGILIVPLIAAIRLAQRTT